MAAPRLTGRVGDGLVAEAAGQNFPHIDDWNQLVGMVLASAAFVAEHAGGAGRYLGGADDETELGAGGTTYPPVALVIVDSGGNVLPFLTSSSKAISFGLTSGSAKLYAIPETTAGVSPAHLVAGPAAVRFVAQAAADSAPAHSLVLGEGTVTASAFTAYTGEGVVTWPVSAHKSTHATGGSDALTPGDIGAVAKTGDETVAGIKTLSSAPVLSSLTASALVVTGAGKELVSGTLTNTANQTTLALTGGALTVTLPQDIGTASTPQFGKLGLGAAAGTSRLTLAAATDAAGGIDFGGDAWLHRLSAGVLQVEAALNVSGVLTLLNGSSQDYAFTNRANNFAIQGKSAGTAATLELFSNDGDGTDAITNTLWAVGTPASVVNSEFGQFVWRVTEQFFCLRTGRAGTGTQRPIVIDATGASTPSQVTFGTNGAVTFGGAMVVRTVASDPKHATPASRPAGVVGETVFYSGKMYFCTNSATPLWEQITSA